MKHPKRTSLVGSLKVINMLNSSVVFIGDNLLIDPRSRAIAVQREVANFQGHEGDFLDPLFEQPFPDIAVESDVELQVTHASPWIRVGRMKIIGVSTSAVIQIGSTSVIDAESRAKLSRQFMYPVEFSKSPADPVTEERTIALAAKVARTGMERLQSL